MDKKKLQIVRNKIDKLDNRLLLLIKERTNLVNQVIKIKKYKNQIRDNVRINKILENIRTKSIKMKIDPMICKRIWTSMIKSYIEYEKKKFKKK
jgi:chorismate mutase